MIITRFPPSPTGDLHIGGVRTALYNWLVARQANGQFILRIEDTDSQREKTNAVAGIIEGMQWLGLDYDAGPIFQSDRYDRYRQAVQQLLDEGKAYYCYCSRERLDKLREEQMANKEKPKYDGHCRDNASRDNVNGDSASHANHSPKTDNAQPVVRFKNPTEGDVVWQDMVHGEIRFANTELDDLIIQRADGSPTYNFCVVVDDIDMQMTHIIRGDDHINNTPRQINIFKAFDATLPQFGHVGMILGDDGKKLSKRHGASSVLAFRDAGYLPAAIINYLVRLGWSHGDQEIFSVTELLEKFDINTVNTAASAFNTEKLNWLNQHYMKTLPPEQLLPGLTYQYQTLGIDTGDTDLTTIIPYYSERAKTLKEMAQQTRWLFEPVSEYPEKAAKKAFHSDAGRYLGFIHEQLAAIDPIHWQSEALHQALETTASHFDVGFGKVGMPLRLALTGGSPSPNIDDILILLGKTKSLHAINTAVDYLNQATT
ncbi:glutamate--tRNA ligase [Ostreibacterium oceani]|uniref:Glutamate--tRNA ligase n=1 Tax=Ostreibacterium oceani TaxID=2654998 RepID=A0A6N7EZG4_9GAMM|nr:glutamate--tRNA ligase [Ostreibacterium oceani]MPV86950.1 glutamate--tRNA ligase [Ostreibacterium oceani]